MIKTGFMSFALAFTFFLPTHTLAQETLTLDRLFGDPSLLGPSVRSVAYAPDSSFVTFLKGRSDDATRRDLWGYDLTDNTAAMLVDTASLEPDDFELSEEEKALRERKRVASSKGIVDYQWDRQGAFVLFSLSSDLFLLELPGKEIRRLTDTPAAEYDGKISPDNRHVSFLRDGALYTINLATGRERRISPEPEEGITYGTAEFVAQEEMDRYTGNWWSPDGSMMVYTRTDETSVDIVPRFDIGADGVNVISQRYPRAGRPNAVVDLFIKRLNGRRPLKVKWGASSDTYLARVNWSGDQALFIQTVNREQTELKLSRVDIKTGDVEAVHVERHPTWINLSNDFQGLGDGTFLWTTEQSGFRHIYHMDADGDVQPVTNGDWVVSSIEAVDPEAQDVYFTGFLDSVLERHLYRVSYHTPGPPQRLTAVGRTWQVEIAPDAGSFVGVSSNTSTPRQTGIYNISGEHRAWIERNELNEDHPYTPFLEAHRKPEFGVLEAEDGQTLHYSVIKPHDFDPNKTYPAIVNVYGGPGVQRVTNTFSRSLLFDQYKQQQGYVVFQLDNRGSSNRGRRFENVLHRSMAQAEVQDQLQAVSFLGALPFVDNDRIGVMGWSYGGYMALHLALRAPDGTFAAAVSGAPVTDWRFYDTFYTERYMDAPADNEDGYEKSSVLPYLPDLDVPLLLIHGMADDNVTFDNSTRIIRRLQTLKKPFEMMTYPGLRHAIHSGSTGQHRFDGTMRFFDRHLAAD